MTNRPRALIASVAVLAAAVLLALMAAPIGARVPASCGGTGWVGAWGTAPAIAGPSYVDRTVRVVVNPTRGARRVLLRLSNRFGTGPFTIDRVTVARLQSGARVVPSSLAPVTFGGRRSVTIPRGADVFSDPARLTFRAFSDLAISIYMRGPSGSATEHPVANEIGSYEAAGDRTNEISGQGFGSPSQAWPFLTGVEVQAPRRFSTLVALGDSITDGFQSSMAQRPGEHNTRWPDFLARRLDRRRLPFSVVNAGISGNRLRLDGFLSIYGPSALARLDSDVLAVPGVREVIILEGINDIGQTPPASPGGVIAALRQVVLRLHLAGLRVLVGTLTPSGGNSVPTYGSPEASSRRTAVNRWIRTSHVPDGVIDFDAAVRDPSKPSRLVPVLDSGDHLHPNARGYQRMANAVPLSLLTGVSCRRALWGRFR
jgi:lysophospholipase L1-like esterase